MGNLKIVPFFLHSTPKLGIMDYTTTREVDVNKRVCKKCGEEKDLDDFYKSKGIHEWKCKKCKSESVKKQYRDNPEKLEMKKQQGRAWYLANRANKEKSDE